MPYRTQSWSLRVEQEVGARNCLRCKAGSKTIRGAVTSVPGRSRNDASSRTRCVVNDDFFCPSGNWAEN